MCEVNALRCLRDDGERQPARHNSLQSMPKEATFTNKHIRTQMRARGHTLTHTHTHTAQTNRVISL